jgi:DNA-binding CsgD family transcriptional regulator
MKKLTKWLKGSADATLEEEAEIKINLLQKFEHELPGVVIVHDLATNSVVYMSQRALEIRGITLEEMQLHNDEYHSRFFNPEDAKYYVPKIIGLVERSTHDEPVSFFQQVRLSPDHPWVWHLSSTKVFLRDRDQRPRLIITVSLAVDTEHPITAKVEKLLEENNFLRRNHHLFASLTPREKEILKRMARGESSHEIAGYLHISEETAKTHRRNIRKKINAQTAYDITHFARSFDLI